MHEIPGRYVGMDPIALGNTLETLAVMYVQRANNSKYCYLSHRWCSLTGKGGSTLEASVLTHNTRLFIS